VEVRIEVVERTIAAGSPRKLRSRLSTIEAGYHSDGRRGSKKKPGEYVADHEYRQTSEVSHVLFAGASRPFLCKRGTQRGVSEKGSR
jgi:hypothetical protein